MIRLKEALNSSLGKKYLMSVSGLAMVGFLVTHLLANLNLYGDGTTFNQYAKALHDLGPLLWVAEIGLIVICALHIVIALGLTAHNKKARGGSYKSAQKSKGGPSYMSAISKNMIITGVVLGIFLVVHVLHMKYGIFSPEAINSKTVDIKGEQALDLYARVVDAFKNPGWVAFYVGVMLFLGAHLRHGFFSAFQSLGALNKRLEKPADMAAKAVAGIFVVGFLFIPIFLFFMKSGA